jgi:hypothetical protein
MILIVVQVTNLIICKKVKQDEKEIEFRYISLNYNTHKRGGGGGGGGRRRRGRRRGRRRRRRRGRRRRRKDGQGSDAPLKKVKTPKVKDMAIITRKTMYV